MGLRMHREVGALRKVLSQQAIGVLVRPARPEWHFWVLRSGAPKRDLPETYGPRTTFYNRFVRWR